MEVVAVLRLQDANCVHHLAPLALSERVSHLWIVRPEAAPHKVPPRSTYRRIRGGNLLLRLWRVYREAARLANRPEVGWLVSFNPLPYGLLALAAGRRAGKLVHLGFVGSDWYRHGRAWYGRLLDPLLRRADLFTVTGGEMRRQMCERGYPAERLMRLPHAVDVDSYEVKPPAERSWDVLFAGRLVALKRVDRILQAVSAVRDQHPDVRLCLLGDGPERGPLEDLARRLGLDRNVTFAGFDADPAPWFSESRIVVLASEREGAPFVLVEAQCAGAVPVSTRVGSVDEMITDGETGLIVPPGEPEALTAAIRRLLGDPELYRRLHEAVVARREELRYSRVAEYWSRWLTRMTAR